MSDLPITVESLDKVPEEFQKFYKPSEAEGDDGGKQYALDPSQVFEAMGAINKALDNQRRVNDSLEKEKKEISKKYEHVDLKKYQQLEEKSKEWETEKERQEKINALKRELEQANVDGDYARIRNLKRKLHRLSK